jgi:hypothetical protein
MRRTRPPDRRSIGSAARSSRTWPGGTRPKERLAQGAGRTYARPGAGSWEAPRRSARHPGPHDPGREMASTGDIWQPGFERGRLFSLFISHTSAHKREVGLLSTGLLGQGIAGVRGSRLDHADAGDPRVTSLSRVLEAGRPAVRHGTDCLMEQMTLAGQTLTPESAIRSQG